MGPITSFADVMSLLRRRMVLIALILCAGIVGTLAYALSLPATYESSTLVQLRSSPLSATTEPLDAARRVQIIEQRLMRRENVIAMIERHDLFADQDALTDDEKVFLFRQATGIRMIDSTGGGGTGRDAVVSALYITAQAGTAQKAADVANDLTASLISQDRDERNRVTDEAMAFLTADAERLSRQLSIIDERITAITEQNEESLPGAAEALRSERAQLRELQLDLERQELALEREQLEVEVRSQSPNDTTANLSLADRLNRLTSDLAQSRRVLPAGHPEIRRIENEIENLRVEGQAGYSSGVQREIELIGSQRDALRAQQRLIASREAAIDRALERAPHVAQQLTALERQQSQLSEQLSSTMLRLSETQSRRALEEEREGGTMTVLETAQPPDYPLSSSRKRVAAMGLMASVGAALMAALVLDLLRPVMRTPGQVRHALGVTPIAASQFRPSRRDRALSVARLAVTVAILVATGATIYQLIENRPDPTGATTAAATPG